MKKKSTSELLVVNNALLDIKSLSNSIDPKNLKKMWSDLADLESQAGALRTFITNHLLRGELEKQN